MSTPHFFPDLTCLYIQRIMVELKRGPKKLRNSFVKLATFLINGHIAEGVKSVAQYHNRQCNAFASLCHP